MNDEKKSLDPQENTPAPEETPAAGPARKREPPPRPPRPPRRAKRAKAA